MATAKATKTNTVTANFILDKETKGAFRLKEVDAKGAIIEDYSDVKIGTVYLRKSALGDISPKKAAVSITLG